MYRSARVARSYLQRAEHGENAKQTYPSTALSRELAALLCELTALLCELTALLRELTALLRGRLCKKERGSELINESECIGG